MWVSPCWCCCSVIHSSVRARASAGQFRQVFVGDSLTENKNSWRKAAHLTKYIFPISIQSCDDVRSPVPYTEQKQAFDRRGERYAAESAQLSVTSVLSAVVYSQLLGGFLHEVNKNGEKKAVRLSYLRKSYSYNSCPVAQSVFALVIMPC